MSAHNDVMPASQVHVPEGWCPPNHQPGAVVWHGCNQYQITGVAPNHLWEFWSYTILPLGHSEQPDYIETMQGYLLEHQVGKEKPAYCEETEP